MKTQALRGLLAAIMATTATGAFAADLYEPPVVDMPPAEVVVKEVSYGGWYIRGDLDYHKTKFKDAKYWTYFHDDNGTPDFDADDRVIAEKNGKLEGEIDEAFSAGLGIGYQVSKHLRTDVTLDHFFEADFEGSTDGFCYDEDLDDFVACSSEDRTSMSAWLLLANAYVELGTYGKFTPYVGAGVGGAHIKWDKLVNTIPGGEFEHKGEKEWRFAWALMAGTSYCLTKNLNLDVGYRFSKVEGGKMFGYDSVSSSGPGEDDGFHVHEARAGLRYQFGAGNAACGEPELVAYEPEPLPPVYK
ncbi:MAG TPA: outer membrane protein [Mesorhizobium sp.]|jgi:opacity protein-like surface antigen|nr:outer membrane protein [Mesorhizobium sp.]